MFCHPLYDNLIAKCIVQFVETNINKRDPSTFILECIYDLNHYNYSENDNTLINKYNFMNFITKRYSVEEIFKTMNGKKAAEVIKELEEIDFIEEMMTDSITLEDILCFYYMGYLHHNKNNIIQYLLEWNK